MKKLYSITLAAIVAAGTCANAANPMPQTKKSDGLFGVSSIKAAKYEAKNPMLRAFGDATQTFTATSAQMWYYGDLAGNGTDSYYLFLSTNGITSGGIPEGPGEMVRIQLVSPFAETPTDGFAAGEYTIGSTQEFAPMTYIPSATEYIDAFWNPELEEGESLVGYQYTVTGGTVTVEKEGSTYAISTDLEFAIEIETEEGVETVATTVNCSYKGEIEFVDPYAYIPLPTKDFQLKLDHISGRYTEGNYSVAFYSDGLLDADGWIVNSGQLLNVELLVEKTIPADYDAVTGEFTYTDFYASAYPPQTFVGGCWYNIFGSYYAAVGTALSLYDSTGNVTNVGLSSGGTINVEKVSGDFYKFDFDFDTPEGGKITGHWEGDFVAGITDFTDDGSGISDINAESLNVSASGRTIFVSGAEQTIVVYDIAGRKIASASPVNGAASIAVPSTGVYFVRSSASSAKILVR